MSTAILKKRIAGVVKSAAMDKTITVVVERLVKHPLYQKYVRKNSVFKAHDEENEAQRGDMVEIVSCRPLSKTKNWRLAKIVQKAIER